MNMKVSVLGCGRLGMPLAVYLANEGCAVRGSSTSADKTETMKQNGIEPFVFKIEEAAQALDPDFFDADVVVVTLPFLRSFKDPCQYLDQIKSVVHAIQQSTINLAVFTSTTSIYPDSDAVVEEDQQLPLSTDRQKVLWECEQLFLNMDHVQSVVLRLAGIWHGARSADLMLGQKGRIIQNSHAKMNTVHYEDCIGIMTQAIENKISAGVYNVCADQHPVRKDFYLKCCEKLGYDVPEFDEKVSSRKIVSNAKIKDTLNYTFQYSDPLQF